jgi:hypothetical protein
MKSSTMSRPWTGTYSHGYVPALISGRSSTRSKRQWTLFREERGLVEFHYRARGRRRVPPGGCDPASGSGDNPGNPTGLSVASPCRRERHHPPFGRSPAPPGADGEVGPRRERARPPAGKDDVSSLHRLRPHPVPGCLNRSRPPGPLHQTPFFALSGHRMHLCRKMRSHRSWSACEAAEIFVMQVRYSHLTDAPVPSPSLSRAGYRPRSSWSRRRGSPGQSLIGDRVFP